VTASILQSILCASLNFRFVSFCVYFSSTCRVRDDCNTMEPDSSMDRRSFEAHERLLLVDEHDIADIEMSSGRECPGSERRLEEKKGIWYLIALTAGLGG
jgi:hypothetical protein